MNQKQLRKHLQNEEIHSVRHLLDHGIHAWLYRSRTEENKQAIENYLASKGMITVTIKIKKEESVIL